MKIAYRPVAAVALCCAAAASHAQSTVTLYGLISAGVGYTTHNSTASNFSALSGTNQNPRWGVRGSEDLGGGMRAVFGLEQGFNVMTGGIAQNNRAFGRQSYVGLGSSSAGMLTLGRQYDTVHDYLGPILIASNGVLIGDNDNSYNNLRIQNSIKYVSPDINNFDFTAVYGIGEAASGPKNNAYSLGLGYKGSPVSLAAVYARMNNPNASNDPDGAVANDYASSLLVFNKSGLDKKTGVKKQDIAGFGGFYTQGAATWGSYFTTVKYNYLDGSSLRLQNFDLNLNYSVTPLTILGIAYTATVGRYDVINTKPRWDQVNLQYRYLLSKRTNLFTNLILQKAGGDAQQANIFGFGASSTREQAMLTVGIRHTF